MPSNSIAFPFMGVSRKQRIAFFTQLEYMLNAGISPLQSLRALSEQHYSKPLRRALLDMIDHIQAGGSLTSAFDRYPNIFSPLERRMVGAAESGGFTSQTLSVLARFNIEIRQLWVRFWVDMIYPGMLLFTALVVCPLLRALFLGNVENLLSALAWNAFNVFIGLFILLIGFRFLLSCSPTRRLLHHFALRIPCFGKIVKRFARWNFITTFANLYMAGLPIRIASQEAAQCCGNETISRRLQKSLSIFDEGGTLSQALAMSGYFDPLSLGMIASGEESGQLDTLLMKCAKYEEQEVRAELQMLSRILPILIYFLIASYGIYLIFSSFSSYIAVIQ